MKKTLLATIGTLCLVALCVVGYSVSKSLRFYDIEGSIHAAFYPLIPALDRFTKDHGAAPRTLDDLVPDYLDKIPAIGSVSEIQYRPNLDQPSWRLTLVSMATGERRLYIAESGIPLSEAEKKQLVLQYHGRWNVIEPKPAEQDVDPNA